ncbi:MAG: ABC-F type ribosomal protection protein [Oscillospiraceae bacterium]|jgi:lincosamide and streptogramin A transport system ATP-binding/permease protein|nr:ABC-F type ribosomal protection protein [Oscillospiraceae bacterium]
MSQIDISHLTFAYDGSYDELFTDVSFRIDTDWKLGFCGRNGRGKTTFLKLLMGEYEYSGSITSSVGFEYFPFAVPDMTIRTMDVLRGIDPGAPVWILEKETGLLDIVPDALDRPFCTLSNGEQTKALLAGLFCREGKFLLIDEPTNHLDMAGREVVARYLNGKSGFILVSHDRAFLDGCVDHILSINRANIEVQSGNFSSWQLNKERRDSYELAENERLKKDIKRLTVSARKRAEWSDKVEKAKIGTHSFDRGHVGHLAAKAMRRSKNIERRGDRAIEEKEGLLKNLESAEPLKLRPLSYHAPRLLSVSELSVRYGERPVFSGLSFSIERGDRVAVVGGNGSGKSSLLKLICGEDIPHAGTVSVGSQLVLSAVPQDTSNLSGRLDDFSQGVDGVLFRAILRKLDFSRSQFEKDLRDFSAGQKKKALLARSLCQHAHLYVWDEPLNYIDVLSRMQIEELILEYRPTLLFVEHDRAFCEKIATKTAELRGG